MLVEKVQEAIVANVFGDREGEVHGTEEATRAAIEAVLDAVASELLAVQYDPAPYTAMKVRLAAMRKEALG